MSDDENMPVANENVPLNTNQSANSNGTNVLQPQEDRSNENEENVGPAKFESKTKLKVTIKNWNGVASWKWIANDDTCGICRVAFDGCCPDCKIPGDDCPLVWGACTHCFHIHCIMKWLNAQQAQHLCPMCRQDWKFKES